MALTRKQIEELVELGINLLDTLDGDSDLEPDADLTHPWVVPFLLDQREEERGWLV